MKLQKETLAIIKNFSTINSNLLIKEGNKLSTITTGKNVMAEATLVDSFPIDFGIYDLNEFLNSVNLFEDPDLQFNDKQVIIKQGSSSIKFSAADQAVLVIPPNKSINFPEADVVFDMSTNMLATIIKTASVLRSDDVAINGDGTTLKLVISDKKNVSANSFELELGSDSRIFRINLKVDNLKLHPTDYKVEVSKKKISKFSSKDGKLVYYIAVESDSTFEI